MKLKNITPVVVLAATLSLCACGSDNGTSSGNVDKDNSDISKADNDDSNDKTSSEDSTEGTGNDAGATSDNSGNDSEKNDASGVICEVTYDQTSVTWFESYKGFEYEMKGVVKGDRIVYTINEKWPTEALATQSCEKWKDDGWYTGITCSGKSVSYSDYDEGTDIASAVDNYKKNCETFKEKVAAGELDKILQQNELTTN